MKKLWLILGGLMLISLMGAGCNLTSLEDVSSDEESDQLVAVQEENQELKDSLADLQKKVDKLEKTTDQKNEKETEMDEMAKNDDQDDDEQDEKENLNERGREQVGDLVMSDSLGDDQIHIYIGSQELGEGSEDPVFKLGCGDYLYGLTIQLDEEKAQSDLATAIVQLLTYKPSESEGENWVRGKGLTLENVTYEDGMRVIELAGEVTLAGTCEAPRLQGQLEETIAIYSDNFEIRLNGSASEWECLFDESGECS